MSHFYVSLFQSHLVSILFFMHKLKHSVKVLCMSMSWTKSWKMNGAMQLRGNNVPESILMLLFSYVIALSIQFKHRQTNTHTQTELERWRTNVACFTITFSTAQPSSIITQSKKREEKQLNSKIEWISRNFRLNFERDNNRESLFKIWRKYFDSFLSHARLAIDFFYE